MIKIKEVIVVEGRDDEINLKQHFDCEVIRTSGFGISKATYNRIKLANETRGVIVLTDPDFAGESIRKRIAAVIPDVKHAFIKRSDAMKGDDIGVENASKAVLEKALNDIRQMDFSHEDIFSKSILYQYKLVGDRDSKLRREKLGEVLGIGYCNGKQLLKRLNGYGITMHQFLEAIKEIEI